VFCPISCVVCEINRLFRIVESSKFINALKEHLHPHTLVDNYLPPAIYTPSFQALTFTGVTMSGGLSSRKGFGTGKGKGGGRDPR